MVLRCPCFGNSISNHIKLGLWHLMASPCLWLAGQESLEDLWIGNTWWVQLWVSWVKPWTWGIYLSYCYSNNFCVCLTTLFQLQYIYNMSSWILWVDINLCFFVLSLFFFMHCFDIGPIASKFPWQPDDGPQRRILLGIASKSLNLCSE